MTVDDLRACGRCLVIFAGQHDPASIMGTCPECKLFNQLYTYYGLARDLREKCIMTQAAAKILAPEVKQA